MRSHHIGGTQSHGALRIPDALGLHPLKLAFGVLRMARERRRDRAFGESRSRAGRKNGAEHVLTTPHGECARKNVVIATNGYTPQHLHPAVRGDAVSRAVAHHRHAAAHRRRDPRDELRHAARADRLAQAPLLLAAPARRPHHVRRPRAASPTARSGNARQRDFLLSELKAKLPGLEAVTVDYDWHGWVCLTRDFLPHVHHAEDDASRPLRRSATRAAACRSSLYAGKLLARRVAGDDIENPIPPFATPLARFPLHSLIRIPQRLVYYWYRFLDNKD